MSSKFKAFKGIGVPEIAFQTLHALPKDTWVSTSELAQKVGVGVTKMAGAMWSLRQEGTIASRYLTKEKAKAGVPEMEHMLVKVKRPRRKYRKNYKGVNLVGAKLPKATSKATGLAEELLELAVKAQYLQKENDELKEKLESIRSQF